MTGNPQLGDFGDGVSEDIISMLARFPDITVVSRNSSFRYKGQAVDIRRVGEELGASHVLEGSVRRDADRLRIVAQLIDTRTGNHVWAERFDRTGADPWALQDEVTGRIVGTLVGQRGMIKRAEYRDAWGKDSANLLEYDYFLRSADLVTGRTPESHKLATAVWNEGLARFPDSTLLKVQGAFLHLSRFINDWTDTPEEEFRRAGELAREAMAQPNLPPMTKRGAHYALAFVNLAERNAEQGLVEAEAAIALAPHDGIYHLGMAEIPIGIRRAARALEWIDKAAQLIPERDPMQALVPVYRAWALTADGQMEEALAELADPRVAPLLTVAPFGRYIRVLRAICLMDLGRIEEAREEVEDLLRFDPNFNDARFRQRNMHFDPPMVEWAAELLAAAGLPK
jgi:adenylate cyclase